MDRNLSDTIEHHPTMTRYARECDAIVEFGVCLGGSTGAFLEGVKGRLYSWDIDACPSAQVAFQGHPKWTFTRGDSRTAEIPECDLLYIDSDHVKAQVAAELLHAPKVRRWIMFHDTEHCPGEVLPPVIDFLGAHPEWFVREVFWNNNGLLVLEKRA